MSLVQSTLNSDLRCCWHWLCHFLLENFLLRFTFSVPNATPNCQSGQNQKTPWSEARLQPSSNLTLGFFIKLLASAIIPIKPIQQQVQTLALRLPHEWGGEQDLPWVTAHSCCYWFSRRRSFAYHGEWRFSYPRRTISTMLCTTSIATLGSHRRYLRIY